MDIEYNYKKKVLDKSIYNKTNFKKFCELKIDKNVKSINKKDLPHEFSGELCEFIDLFRRKTANEKTEWNFFIDYESDEIIHCLHGKQTNVKNLINSGLMKGRKIMTIHNHPNGTYSAPSAANFEILKHEFEDYEIVCSENEYWIVTAKGEYEINFRNRFKEKIEHIFNSCDSFNMINMKKANSMYSINLKKFINNNYENISITNREYIKMIEKNTSEWTLSIRDGGHEFSKRRAKHNWDKYHGNEEEKRKLRDEINKLFGSDEKLKKELFPTLY